MPSEIPGFKHNYVKNDKKNICSHWNDLVKRTVLNVGRLSCEKTLEKLWILEARRVRVWAELDEQQGAMGEQRGALGSWLLNFL